MQVAKLTVLCLIMVMLLALCASLRLPERWEYDIQFIPEGPHTATKLNLSGASGWDIVNIRRASMKAGTGTADVWGTEVILKRRR